MSPAIAVQDAEPLGIRPKGIDTPQPTIIREPLESKGILENYEHFNATPIIGTEFPTVQLTEILIDDAKIRDLAILGTTPCKPNPPITQTTKHNN
jgi:hypothetical protein